MLHLRASRLKFLILMAVVIFAIPNISQAKDDKIFLFRINGIYAIFGMYAFDFGFRVSDHISVAPSVNYISSYCTVYDVESDLFQAGLRFDVSFPGKVRESSLYFAPAVYYADSIFDSESRTALMFQGTLGGQLYLGRLYLAGGLGMVAYEPLSYNWPILGAFPYIEILAGIAF